MIGADGFSPTRLKEVRLWRGMTQNDLAVKAGCAQASMIWRYETGHTTPTAVTIAKLAKALRVSPSRLMKKRGYR